MTKQNVGKALFYVAVIWAIAWGVVGSISASMYYRTLTMDELNQTKWAVTGPLFMVWAIGGVPLGSIVALVGVMLHSGARGSTVWKYGIGAFLALPFSMSIGLIGHHTPVFGVGGTIILLLFVGVLWLWQKERAALVSSPAAADLRLVGYVLFLIAAWFVCGIASFPFAKAFEKEPLGTPLHIMVLFVLGWLFMFLSHYKAQKQQA